MLLAIVVVFAQRHVCLSTAVGNGEESPGTDRLPRCHPAPPLATNTTSTTTDDRDRLLVSPILVSSSTFALTPLISLHSEP